MVASLLHDEMFLVNKFILIFTNVTRDMHV